MENVAVPPVGPQAVTKNVSPALSRPGGAATFPLSVSPSGAACWPGMSCAAAMNATPRVTDTVRAAPARTLFHGSTRTGLTPSRSSSPRALDVRLRPHGQRRCRMLTAPVHETLGR